MSLKGYKPSSTWWPQIPETAIIVGQEKPLPTQAVYMIHVWHFSLGIQNAATFT